MSTTVDKVRNTPLLPPTLPSSDDNANQTAPNRSRRSSPKYEPPAAPESPADND
ncbi:hypothetical protein IMZ48_43860 [Candidatus Bathyarchaeota archaeon]|nr:hypothetical protein [Candidatus Bathyarchaeota archaeon]